MEFKEIILDKLHSLFTEHGLTIIEQSKNIIEYESSDLVITISHNPRENSNTLWLGRKQSNDSIEIDNQVMHEFFHTDLKLKNLSKESFINNLFLFFSNDGEKLLKGNGKLLIRLEKFDKNRSEKFTLNLINEQYLENANRAWKSSNYLDFIKNIKELDIDKLPPSYKKKINIANKRLDGADL